ncbi:MAG TPA: hypothetical protein VGC36_16110 [Rhizomicrobium sp.]
MIRAGENRVFLVYPQTATNRKGWSLLREVVTDGTLAARACYCSVSGTVPEVRGDRSLSIADTFRLFLIAIRRDS